MSMERLTDRFDGQAILICENETCKIYGDGMCSSANPCNTEQNMIDRLAEYEDAEEQGLLIRLPCKIGTPCYKIWQFGSARKVIDWVFDYDDIPNWMCDTFPTREEAEESLKGRTLGG